MIIFKYEMRNYPEGREGSGDLWGANEGRSIENLSNFPTVMARPEEQRHRTRGGEVVNVIVLFQALPLNSTWHLRESRLKYFYSARSLPRRDISCLHSRRQSLPFLLCPLKLSKLYCSHCIVLLSRKL